MVDTFQDGTTMGWSGAGPSNVPNMGPMGAGDNALLVPNGSQGIATYNETQWTGNFTAAGITRISMDVFNENEFDLFLRLGLSKGLRPGGHGFGDTYVTIDSIVVPQGNQWHTIVFDFTAADIIRSLGNSEPAPNPAAALTDVAHFRVINNSEPQEFVGTNFGTLRLDNIKALGPVTGGNTADFDSDQGVDGNDFLIWQRGLGVGTTRGTGDADNNGVVDAADLAVWKTQFGTSVATGAASAVPEPSALALASMTGLWFIRAGRRRS